MSRTDTSTALQSVLANDIAVDPHALSIALGRLLKGAQEKRKDSEGYQSCTFLAVVILLPCTPTDHGLAVRLQQILNGLVASSAASN